MEEWKEYKIGDICRIKHGFAFKGIHFVDEPQRYVCVTPGNFALKGGFKNDKPKYYNGPIPEDYILQKDDLVVTMTDLSKNGDTLGYSALIPYDEHYIFLHNQRIGLIEDISTYIDKHFLYWVMRTYDYQRYIVGHCSGSTVKHTSPTGIGSYVFRCPDMKMQKEISSVLDNLDDKIEVNRRINDNLEQQAQALFKSWFVDFEPFRDQPFVESELGMIPNGWRVGPLGEIMNITSGKRPLKKETKPIEDFIVPLIGASGIMGYTNSVLFNEKILVIGRVGTHGVVQRFNTPCWPSDNTLVIKSSFYEYCYQILCSIDYTNLNRGSTQPLITQTDIKNQLIVIPPIEVISNFEVIVSTLMNLEIINVEESSRLAELRDTLLPRLMSGELSVDGLKGQFAVSPGRCPGSKEHVSNNTAL